MPDKRTGGQAFPRAARAGVPGNEWEGMTLRDWFAGQALPGILATHNRIEMTATEIASRADEISDAMIAKRDA